MVNAMGHVLFTGQRHGDVIEMDMEERESGWFESKRSQSIHE